jgi:glycosyltransferase involved in cell wall biosynthesis
LSIPGKRILFVYLGRRGAVSQLALELARAAPRRAVLAVSRQNELYDRIAATEAPVIAVDTFSGAAGALLALPRVLAIRRRLVGALQDYGIDTVVVLMAHVWTPLIAPALKRAGARYVVIAHDAGRHAGDATGLLTPWLLRDARQADKVVTLSRSVARELIEQGGVPADRVQPLFLPFMGTPAQPTTAASGAPAFLFFGRIMRYKGLPLFLEACEILRQEGFTFGVGVVGEGDLGHWRPVLERWGAEIVNRWVEHDEIAAVMSRYHAVVVPSIDASQSGVVPVAQGHGLPAIVTPAGGLVEQVDDGVTGLIAGAISASAVADQMRRFLVDPGLRQRLWDGIRSRRDARSMARFVEALTDAGI